MYEKGDHIVKLLKEEQERFKSYRFTGKFHALIEDIKREIALREVRQPNKEGLILEFDDHSINSDLSNN